jgi:hypothetical protein
MEFHLGVVVYQVGSWIFLVLILSADLLPQGAFFWGGGGGGEAICDFLLPGILDIYQGSISPHTYIYLGMDEVG